MSIASKQIKLGAAVSYIAIAFNILSGLLYTPWMVNSIGKDQYALYTLATSVINLFLLDFGIGAAVSKFLSNFYARGEQDKANCFMGIVYKVFFAISAIIAVVLFTLYFFLDRIYVKLTPSEITVFKNLFIVVSVYSVLSFPCTTFNGTLMANERFIEVKLCKLGHKALDVALIVVCLLLDLGVYALVMVHSFTSAVFHLAKYLIIKKKTKQRANIRFWDKGQAKELFGFSIWVTIMNIAQRCIFNIMPSIIAALIGSVEVAFFSLASTVEGYIYTFAGAINGMFLPKISRILVSDNKEEKLNSLMIKVGKFHTYTIGLIVVGFLCLGKQFVNIWLGSGYESVYYCAIFIIVPCLIELPQQVAKTSLLASDIVRQQAFVYGGMALINLVAALILVPILGAAGAGVSIFIAYLFRIVAKNMLYKKYLPIDLKKYFISTYKGWLIPAAITAICGTIISKALPVMNFMTFGASVLCMTIVYAIALWFIGIDKNSKEQFLNKLYKNKKS